MHSDIIVPENKFDSEWQHQSYGPCDLFDLTLKSTLYNFGIGVP